MRIGGFQKLSLIEYPGKISCVVFTMGCNLRCPYCHVPQLVLPERMKGLKEIPASEIFSFLEKNKDLDDAVVITGGEPTLQPDLYDFIRRIKEMDYLVAIETNGTNFEMLKLLIEEGLVDYVEMDIKNRLDFERYNLTVGNVLTREMFENIKKSIELLLKDIVPYEFRTTLVKEFHGIDDVVEIARTIKEARVYYLQNLEIRRETIGKEKFTPVDRETLEEMIKRAGKFVRVIER